MNFISLLCIKYNLVRHKFSWRFLLNNTKTNATSALKTVYVMLDKHGLSTSFELKKKKKKRHVLNISDREVLVNTLHSSSSCCISLEIFRNFKSCNLLSRNRNFFISSVPTTTCVLRPCFSSYVVANRAKSRYFWISR